MLQCAHPLACRWSQIPGSPSGAPQDDDNEPQANHSPVGKVVAGSANSVRLDSQTMMAMAMTATITGLQFKCLGIQGLRCPLPQRSELPESS